MGIYPPALLLDGGKPDQLQIHVVVGNGRRNVLHKPVYVVNAPVTLERRAERPADILSKITAFYLVVILSKFQIIHVFNLLNLHDGKYSVK